MTVSHMWSQYCLGHCVISSPCYFGHWDYWSALLVSRNQSLHKLLQEWKQAAMISREEYDQNLAQSQEHYHRNQLRHCFSHWHDLLLTERTVTAANHKLVRSVCWQPSLCVKSDEIKTSLSLVYFMYGKVSKSNIIHISFIFLLQKCICDLEDELGASGSLPGGDPCSHPSQDPVHISDVLER